MNKNIRKLFFIGFFCASIGLVPTACDHNANEPINTPKTNVYEANLNPTDPNLINITKVNGDKLYFLGEKDSKGLPVRVSQIYFQQSGSEDMMCMRFDESQRVIDFTNEKGVRMLFDWISDDKAALTLIEPETGEQLNTVVDFSQTDVQSQQAPTESKPKGASQHPRKGEVSLSVKQTDQEVGKKLQATVNAPSTIGGRVGNLYVSACGGMPYDGQCWVKVYRVWENGPNTWLTTLDCKRIGAGHYQYTLPALDANSTKLSDYCQPIANVIKSLCNTNTALTPIDKQLICLSISGALALGTVTAPAAVAFEPLCAELALFMDAYCSFIDMTDFEYVQDICNLIKAHDVTLYESELLVVPILNSLPKMIEGTPAIFKPGQSLLDLKIDAGGLPAIREFILEPPAPVAYQGYDAKAYLTCLPKGSKITMSIVGTDNYTNTVNYTIQADELNYEATMGVPGSYAGVKDVCTIIVDTPSGESLKKTATLVFH